MIKLFQNADEDRAYILRGLKFDNNFFLKALIRRKTIETKYSSFTIIIIYEYS